MARECRMVAMQEEREQKVSLSTASLIEARDDALSATFALIFFSCSIDFLLRRRLQCPAGADDGSSRKGEPCTFL